MKKFLFLVNALFFLYFGHAQTTYQKADTIQFMRHTNSLRAGSCSSPDGDVTEGAITSSTDPRCYPVNTSFGGGSGSVTYCFSLTAPTGTNVGMDFACFYSHTCNSISWTNAVMYNSPSCTVLTNPAPLDLFNPGEFTPGGSYVFCYTMTKSGGGCEINSFCPYFETFTVAPITISEFRAEPMGQKNSIFWSTSSESNNEWQIIERSSNGLDNWEEVDKVSGSMHSETIKTYEIFDDFPHQLTFYRIKSIDFDGKVQLSSIVSVKRDKDQGIRTLTSPNPTFHDLKVQVAGYTTNTNMKVYNSQGILVLEKIENNYNRNFEQIITLETSNLPSGVYHLQIVNANAKSVHRFIKL
ncbi:MAG: T9SS type A sorting domain-containing protein [Saprospiraceae bacterium]